MPDIQEKFEKIQEEDSSAVPQEFGITDHQLSFKDLLRLATRIFTVKPARTFLTILGTSVGIATVVFLISLGYGLQYILLGKLVTTQDSLITLQAFYPSESNLTISQSTVDKIGQMPEVAEIGRVGEFSGEAKVGGLSGLIVANIADPNYFRLSGTAPDIGSDFTKGDGVVVTNQALRLVNLAPDASSLNKTIDLNLLVPQADGSSRSLVPQHALKIIGIESDESAPPTIITPVDDFNQVPESYKEILVKAKDLNTVTSLKDKLTAQGFAISARLDLVNQAQKVMNIITITLAVFGTAALVVSAIGMFNTMIVGFLERIYEVGVMKALGATDRDVRNLFLMESFIMGFLGGAVGVLIGMGGGEAVNLIFAQIAMRLGGKPVDLFITPVWFVAMIIGVSAFIGLIAGYWPARKAKSLSPKEAFLRK